MIAAVKIMTKTIIRSIPKEAPGEVWDEIMIEELAYKMDKFRELVKQDVMILKAWYTTQINP